MSLDWRKELEKIEKELRQLSDDELNKMVSVYSGLPEQDFLAEGGAFILLLQEQKVFSLTQGWSGGWLNPGPRIWGCRFNAPEWCCVQDENLSRAIVLAYLVGKRGKQEAEKWKKRLWGDKPPWHATIEIDRYTTEYKGEG